MQKHPDGRGACDMRPWKLQGASVTTHRLGAHNGHHHLQRRQRQHQASNGLQQHGRLSRSVQQSGEACVLKKSDTEVPPPAEAASRW